MVVGWWVKKLKTARSLLKDLELLLTCQFYFTTVVQGPG